MMIGSLLCGSSIWIENGKRRRDGIVRFTEGNQVAPSLQMDEEWQPRHKAN
jgi:hypothetical protein